MKPTRLVVSLSLAAVVLGAGAFTAIAAPALHLASAAATSPKASPGPGDASAQAYCDSFLADLAGRLGVTQDKLKSSVKDSLKKSIDDAVARGDLTADQAKKLKARVDAVQGCQQITAPGVFGRHRQGAGRNPLDQLTTAAATALQQTPDVVRKDLMAGQTLHQVANLKNINKGDFDTAFKAALKAQTNPQVTAGKITTEQQTKLIDRAAAMADKLWDSALKDLGKGLPGRPPGPPVKPPTAIQ